MEQQPGNKNNGQTCSAQPVAQTMAINIINPDAWHNEHNKTTWHNSSNVLITTTLERQQ
jgi:hypothetical protein